MAGCRGFALAIGVGAVMALTGGMAEAKQVAVIPAPASLHAGGRPFTLTRDTRIVAKTRAARKVAGQLAGVLRPSTGYRLPVAAHGHGIELRIAHGASGREGYQLRSGRGGVELRAATAAGLFHGVQTLRQLLPARIESPTRAARAVDRGRRAHRRPPALPLPRRDARRLPALLHGRRGRALHRPARAVQDQHAPPAPVRRPGLADRYRQVAAAGDLRRQHRGRRRPRRLLHEGRLRGV